MWPETEALEEIPLMIRAESIARSLPTYKAPGPDGVPDVIVKYIIQEKSELILDTINRCLTQGCFTKTWKEATLILLLKGRDYIIFIL